MGVGIFVAIIMLLFSYSVLRAELEAKAKEAEKTQAMNEALNKTEAQKQPNQGFRQKLKEIITEEEVVHEMDSYVRYMPSRSLKDQPGEVSIIDSESEYSYAFKAFGKLPIELSVNSEYVDIGASDAVPVSLPAHLTGVGFGAQATTPFFFDKTYLRLKIMPSFYSQNWNFKSSSFRIPAQLFLIYQPNEKWTFIAGVAAYPGFETPILPIGGFIYKANDKLTFNIIPARPTISYSINDRITVFAEGGFSGGEYRVTKDGYKGAVLSYNEIHCGGGVEFTLNKYIDLSISSGYMFNRYLKYRDSLGKVNLKNDLYSELRVEVGI